MPDHNRPHPHDFYNRRELCAAFNITRRQLETVRTSPDFPGAWTVWGDGRTDPRWRSIEVWQWFKRRAWPYMPGDRIAPTDIRKQEKQSA